MTSVCSRATGRSCLPRLTAPFSSRPREVQALVTQPGHTHTTHIEDVPAVEAREGEVLVRTLEVGVCGTDREISEGLFGIAPEGEPLLVLGHEALAVVERDGYGFARGELVTATVRRSCARSSSAQARSACC